MLLIAIWYICFWKLAVPTKIGSHLDIKLAKNSQYVHQKTWKNVYSTTIVAVKTENYPYHHKNGQMHLLYS